VDSPGQARRREEIMRPWPTLGYDHDRIALHMLHIDALPSAESELRRAVWLNPYEWQFKYHLACCLFRKKEYEEAGELTQSILRERSEETCCLDLLREIEAELARKKRQ